MKPDEIDQVEEILDPVTGDVIGDTAYSERFVLKILLKLANLDTLKDEIKEKSFEDELCTLWDMTAEKDVVLFLQKHDVSNLFQFALPMIESSRIIEIIIGVIGNMCCQKEVVSVIMKNDVLLSILLENIKSDDSLILIQLLRLINSCLFLANDEDLSKWMRNFLKIEYSSTLYFILRNSSNKELLITALENFNTLCSYCNKGKLQANFFTHFVTLEAVESLAIAFTEITVNQKDMCNRDEIERILVISLQILLNLVGFDKSKEVYQNINNVVATMINVILHYYEKKLVEQKEVDSDLVDIIDSTNTIVKVLEMSETSDPDKYFIPSYNIWKVLGVIKKSEKNKSNTEEDNNEIKEFSEHIYIPLCNLLCIYMAHCSDKNLLNVLDLITIDYEGILSVIEDKDLQTAVSKRAVNYRTRLKENVDS